MHNASVYFIFFGIKLEYLLQLCIIVPLQYFLAVSFRNNLVSPFFTSSSPVFALFLISPSFLLSYLLLFTLFYRILPRPRRRFLPRSLGLFKFMIEFYKIFACYHLYASTLIREKRKHFLASKSGQNYLQYFLYAFSKPV